MAATVIISVILAGIIALAVRSVVKRHKSGGCGCGCADCPQRCGCSGVESKRIKKK